MREDIVSFHEAESINYPFYIEMAGISYCDGTYRISRNNSPIFVFEYILDGQGTVITEQSQFHPVKGDVYILHQNSTHTYYSDKKYPWTKIWFNAKGPLIGHLLDAYKLSSINYLKSTDFQPLFDNMLEIAKSTGESAETLFMKASLVFHQLAQAIFAKVNGTTPDNNTEALKIKQYLDRHIEDTVSLKELSNLVYLSPAQVIRIFKKEYNSTPYDYLLNKKIEAAKLLLTNTNLMIKQISTKLNFADEHYFSNYFKNKTGATPLNYRNRMRDS